MKAQCINDTWINGIKDPDLTKNKTYEITDTCVSIYGFESRIRVIGDRGEEIDRPCWIFKYDRKKRKKQEKTGRKLKRVLRKHVKAGILWLNGGKQA